jgi:hypothetical protein
MNIITKNAHRFVSNPLEKKYYDAWIEENRFGKTLEYILGDNNRRADDVSDRDKMVAATVIQWLGSPVGQGFSESVMKGEK